MRASAVAAAFACVAACVAPAWAALPAGGVYVTTLPADADVWLDGTYVGRSPVLVDGLAPGRHAITIVKSGWSLLELPVEVTTGRTEISGSVLAAAGVPAGFGTLVARAVPPGAELDVDGSAIPGPPGKPIPLATGTHRVTVTMPGGRVTRSVRILADVVTQVVLAPPHGPLPSDGPSAVVAPAADYLPTDAIAVRAERVVIRYGGHVCVARMGDPTIDLDGARVVYPSAAEVIGGKLYMPLALLEKLSGDTAK